MNHFAGLLDGRSFAAEKPFVVLGWPTKSAVTTFATKQEVWNYIESASRGDKRAIFARVYEFSGGVWNRIPAQPTYLQKLELQQQNSGLMAA